MAADPEIGSIFIFLEMGLGLAFPPHFVYEFSRSVSPAISCSLTKFHYLITFNFWDIGMCIVNVNQAVTSLILRSTLNFLWSRFPASLKKLEQKFKDLENENSF